MAERSTIAWTDSTFNPVIGCTEVSPACDNCYAREFSKAKFPVAKWGAGQPRYRTSESNWKQPVRWNRKAAESGQPHRVFCGSLCDIFDNEWPDEIRADLWRLIWNTPALTWLLLTKRIGNAAKMLPGCPPRNIWLGATIANQEEADRDLDKLRSVPVAIRFLSLEPLLGPIHFEHLRGIDWVIVGAESGSRRRPFDHSWLRQIADKCRDERVPLFVKQDSSLRPGARGKIPDDLWVREVPERAGGVMRAA